MKQAVFISFELLGINRFFRWKNSGKVKVLMFHSISTPGRYFDNSISPDDFSASLRYLLKNYSILRLTQDGQLLGHCPNKVNILLTFDDGFVDNLKVAAPMLKEFGITGVFFVISECLKEGSTPKHIEIKSFKSEVDIKAYNTMTVMQVRELIGLGMTVGSHGCNHPDYTTVDFQAGIQDAVVAKVCIQQILGITVSSFAFPWGRYQEKQSEVLKQSYQRIFTTDHGFNFIQDRVFCRNEVASFFHLRCATSGSLDYFKSWVSNFRV